MLKYYSYDPLFREFLPCYPSPKLRLQQPHYMRQSIAQMNHEVKAKAR